MYRVEATLNRCVESVTNQSFDDFEVILVDDGSPDRCPLMCDEWAQKDPRITVIHQTNAGLSAARNAGIDRARGDYLTFVDSDDFIGTETLCEVVEQLDDNDILEYPVCRFFGKNRQEWLRLEDKTYTNMDDYWLNAKVYLHTYACNKIYRRQMFEEVRFPVGRVFEDAYTLPQLLRRARKVATTSQGTYYYCDNSQGITATANGQQLRQLLDAHLSSGMPIDDLYYLHLLNIQIDVCELTGDEPRLPKRHVVIVGNKKQKLKAKIVNILGIKGICRISKILHRFKTPSR